MDLAAKSRFQFSERTRALPWKRDDLTFKMITVMNAEKELSTCLELFSENLFDVQMTLPSEYCNEIVLQNELLHANYNIEPRRHIYHTPADTVKKFISKLHT